MSSSARRVVLYRAERFMCCTFHRSGQWPPDIIIDTIFNFGCILVPVGPKEIENNELLWRISFSMAEKQLCSGIK
jgi:hypothetical protein